MVGGKVVVCTGDCLPAIQHLQMMVNAFPQVKQLCLFPAARDIHLGCTWQSRECNALLHADVLSRIEHSSKIFLSIFAFRHILCLRAMALGGASQLLMCSLVVLVTSTQRPSTSVCSINQVHLLPMPYISVEVAMHVAMACQVLLGIPPFALTGAV